MLPNVAQRLTNNSAKRVRSQDAIIAESQVAFRSIDQFAGVAVENLVHPCVSHGQSFGVRKVRNDIVRDTIGREAVPWAKDIAELRTSAPYGPMTHVHSCSVSLKKAKNCI